MSERTDQLRERAGPALAALAVQVAVGYALVAGLGVSLPAKVSDELKLFAVAPPAPPPRPKIREVPPPRPTPRPQGAAAPPNLRARRSEIVAPPPTVPLVLPPPPVIVAEEPGTGFQPTQGAAPDPGPGTGAGGEGEGTGSGAGGDGDGGGRGESPPKHLKGRITGGDYPPASAAAGLGGTVSVRYTVEIDGRVTGCRITRSSGQADLDETTCRLIEQRFRYRPWRDAAGRPVASTVVQDHEWVAPPPDPKPEERKRLGFRLFP